MGLARSLIDSLRTFSFVTQYNALHRSVDVALEEPQMRPLPSDVGPFAMLESQVVALDHDHEITRCDGDGIDTGISNPVGYE